MTSSDGSIFCGMAVRASRVPRATFALVAGSLLLSACVGNDVAVPDLPLDGASATGVLSGPVLFEEITSEIGLSPSPGPWPDGTHFLPEITGPGVALFDYDNDGNLDIFQAQYPPPDAPDQPAPNRLYRQQRDGTFVDVTESAGIGHPGKGQGVAVGDVDNDGDLDVYVANYGPDAFYRNNGDGSFTNATAEAGITGDGWSSSAAFCDYDRDGDLDLYVARYLQYEFQGDCLDSDGRPDYCGPSSFDGVPDLLYNNDGTGKFTDVTSAAGMVFPGGGKTAKGLGVLCVDLSDDSLPDIYVANDGEPNLLWVNRGDGTFSEEATPRGAAVNRHGLPEASMGVSVGDVDGDGFLDLFMTHLRRENNTLYHGGPGTLFADRTLESKLADHDLALTGFGCAFLDYDLDGDLDVAVANGRVSARPALSGAMLSKFWNRYAEPNLLYENDGSGVFRNVSDRAAEFSARIEISRGLAVGDLDNDGDPDMVLSNVGNHLRVFRNVAPRAGRHWLRLRVRTGSRNAVGAKIRVRAGGRDLLALALPESSYQSSSDPRVIVGLGEADSVDWIEVVWPDGSRERFSAEGVDREITLEQGSGELI